jgi:hypothetical protein
MKLENQDRGPGQLLPLVGWPNLQESGDSPGQAATISAVTFSQP